MKENCAKNCWFGNPLPSQYTLHTLHYLYSMRIISVLHCNYTGTANDAKVSVCIFEIANEKNHHHLTSETETLFTFLHALFFKHT